MKKNDTLKSLDDAIFKMLDDNKDLVELQEKKAKLLQKFCRRCGKSLKDYIECRCKDDVVHPNEYMTWTSVADDIGALDYDCYECVEHFRKIPHLPDGHRCNECIELNKKLKN